MNKFYLANHKICVAPVESKVAEDASLELLYQLYIQRVSIQFGFEVGIDILLTSFGFPSVIGGQLAELRAFSSVFESYLPCCMHACIYESMYVYTGMNECIYIYI